MSTRMQLQWRRAKTLELSSKGYSQVEIASQLQVNEVTVSRDMAYLRKQAREFAASYPRNNSRIIRAMHDRYETQPKTNLGDRRNIFRP